ncbi:MFS transporter [Nocardioides sp.]|uniref:MFS transporter n=1 Tax=Nocardioides sp. TaxID=35761 RepID=UPI003516858A
MPDGTTRTTGSTTTPAQDRHGGTARLAVGVVCAGGFTVSLTQTLVIPLQGDLPRLLGASPADAGWVVTITLLAAAVAMPIAGRLGDLLGKQRVLLASAALLLLGSVVSGLSTSLAPMLAGRLLQGLAMGFIPVGIALLREVSPPELTHTAVAAMSATLGVGGAIGLPLAAWATQTFDWHAVFWLAALLAAALLVAVAVLVPRPPARAAGRLDVVGAVLLAVGLVGVLLAVSQGHEWGWTSPRTLTSVCVGVAVLLVWGVHQVRSDDPLVDLRASAQRPVLLTNVAAVAIGFGMMAQSIVVPQLLQLPAATGFGLDQSILAAGLWMAPGGLVMMAFAPVSSRLMSALGPRSTLMIGAGVLAVGYLVAFAMAHEPWQLLIASSIASAGVGIGYAAMPTLIMGAVPLSQAASAVGLNALMRSVGTTTAAAVMTTVLASNLVAGPGGVHATEGAYRACFLIGAAAALLGVALTALVPRRTSAPDHVQAAPTPAEALEAEAPTAG